MPPRPEEIAEYYDRAAIHSHAARVERQADPVDELYEQALKRCRREGHDFTELRIGGRVAMECARCGLYLEETDR